MVTPFSAGWFLMCSGVSPFGISHRKSPVFMSMAMMRLYGAFQMGKPCGPRKSPRLATTHCDSVLPVVFGSSGSSICAPGTMFSARHERCVRHEHDAVFGVGHGRRVDVAGAGRAAHERPLARGMPDLDRRVEERPGLVVPDDLNRLLAQRRREVDQVVLGQLLDLERLGPGGKRLRRRQHLAGEVRCGDGTLFDRPDRAARSRG